MRVAVIGAGVVGCASALAVSARGHAVVLIDPEPPGEGASFGNAGGLSAGSIVPLAGPGLLRSVPGWLIDPLGPLTVRWRYLPALAPWLLQFIRAGASPERIEAQAQALAALNGPVMAQTRELAELAGARALIRQAGHLTVYRSAQAMVADARGWELRRQLGVEMVTVADGELRQLEPALSKDFTLGVLLPGNGHCIDPRGLTRLFAEAAQGRGAALLRERASGIETRADKAVCIVTDRARHEIDAVVIAAGAWSRPLAKAVGDDVPLETERGYHLHLADAQGLPSRPIMEGEAKFASTPMADGLRVAGTVELAGLAASPDWRRADRLYPLARRLFPDLPVEPRGVTRWMGHRPSLPDSLPVIGPASGASNVFHAFGHGHTGLTGAAMTARIVADLVDRAAPPIDIRPFRAMRFRDGGSA